MKLATYNFYFNIIAGCSLVLRRILAIKKQKGKEQISTHNANKPGLLNHADKRCQQHKTL